VLLVSLKRTYVTLNNSYLFILCNFFAILIYIFYKTFDVFVNCRLLYLYAELKLANKSLIKIIYVIIVMYIILINNNN